MEHEARVGRAVASGAAPRPTLTVAPGAAHLQPWLLLHGTDGRETDLLPLAARVAPDAATLGVRGSVRTPDGFAHFHRRPDRSIDEADLRTRAEATIRLVQEALDVHRLPPRPVALGYSNGAILVAAIMALQPGLLGAAVLVRPLAPFRSREHPRLPGLPVLLVEAARDARRSPGDASRLEQLLGDAGARVVRRLVPTEHPLGALDALAIEAWLQQERPLDGR